MSETLSSTRLREALRRVMHNYPAKTCHYAHFDGCPRCESQKFAREVLAEALSLPEREPRCTHCGNAMPDAMLFCSNCWNDTAINKTIAEAKVRELTRPSVQPAPGAGEALARIAKFAESLPCTTEYWRTDGAFAVLVKDENCTCSKHLILRELAALRSASPVGTLLPVNVDLLLVSMAQHIHCHTRGPNRHKGKWNECQSQPCKDVSAIRAGASPVAEGRPVFKSGGPCSACGDGDTAQKYHRHDDGEAK